MLGLNVKYNKVSVNFSFILHNVFLSSFGDEKIDVRSQLSFNKNFMLNIRYLKTNKKNQA